MKPNFYACEMCPQWDDINGCWDNCKTYCGKEFDTNGEVIDEMGETEYG